VKPKCKPSSHEHENHSRGQMLGRMDKPREYGTCKIGGLMVAKGGRTVHGTKLSAKVERVHVNKYSHDRNCSQESKEGVQKDQWASILVSADQRWDHEDAHGVGR